MALLYLHGQWVSLCVCAFEINSMWFGICFYLRFVSLRSCVWLYLKWIPCSSRGKSDTNGHAAARHFCLITRTAWRWGRCWRPLAFRGPSGISIESTTRRRTHCRTKRSTYRNSGGPRRDGERRGDRTRTKEQRRHAFNFTALVGAISFLPYLCWQIVHIRKFSRTRIYVLFHMGDDGTSCSWWILNFLKFSVCFRLAYSGIWISM